MVPQAHIRADAPYKLLWEAMSAYEPGVWRTTSDLAETMVMASGAPYKASRVREMLDVLERIGAVKCKPQGRTVAATRVGGVHLEFVSPVTHLTAPDRAACTCETRYTLRIQRASGPSGP